VENTLDLRQFSRNRKIDPLPSWRRAARLPQTI
jgi:hypothetical protein